MDGDRTRGLSGSGAGFFSTFNRNKKSLAVNLADPRGLELMLKLIGTADVFSENFKGGAMERLGLGYAALSTINPRLVYVSLKGFLPGPYEHRTALDEVVQMMGGLAYMTGPERRPLRAGISVNDIMGGRFGAVGAMAALAQREKTGRGQEVKSALFENNVFLVAQHMMQYAVTGQAASPMPSRVSAWAVYDVLDVRDGEQIFLAVVTDTQWAVFCDAFGLDALRADPRLATNNLRVQAREWMLPVVRERLSRHSAAEIAAEFERIGLPHAPITRPQDLFEDPHLRATGGLAEVTVPEDASNAGHSVSTRTALLPFTLGRQRLPPRTPPPRLGQDTAAVLRGLSYSDTDIAALSDAAVVRLGPAPAGPS